MKYFLFTHEMCWACKEKSVPVFRCTYLYTENRNDLNVLAERITVHNRKPVQNPVWTRPPRIKNLFKDICGTGEDNRKEITKAEAVAIALIADRKGNI